jgi:predicted dithiol-disulfide oxidoreductase (DUF899 family)
VSFTYPNESSDYREKRNVLLQQEIKLRSDIERVAQLRRELPLGGKLKEDYVFEQLVDGAVREVPFAALFGDHETLLLYSMMYGAEWDAPCPSCTSIVDGLEVAHLATTQRCALAAVADADAEKLGDWTQRRGWRNIPLVSGRKNSYIMDYAGYDACKDAGMVSNMNVFRNTSEGIFHFWASELVDSPMEENGSNRHVDMIWPMWNLLDMIPEGRGDIMVPRQNYKHKYFSEHVLRES